MTGAFDVPLDQACGHCGGDLILLADSDGFLRQPTIVQHEDSEREADHRVSALTV